MIIGILSDSHGRAEAVRQAVTVLRHHGAERLFHCGDVGNHDTLDELLELPTVFVWGNMDRPTPAAHAYCESVGLSWPEPPVVVNLDGKRIGVCHGHERFVRTFAEEYDLDYLLIGHSHQRGDLKQGKTRIINPGALHRASPKTVATLDLDTDELTFLSVPDGRIV